MTEFEMPHVHDFSEREKTEQRIQKMNLLDLEIDEARWIDFINGGGLLKGVPKGQRSRMVCLAAVKRNGRSLGEVPHFNIDAEMVDAALIQTALALKFVPDKLKTLKRCLDAISRDEKVELYIPEDLLFDCNIKLYKRKIKKGMILKNIKKKYRTKELCQYAIECNWKNLEYCPAEYMTEELVIKSLSQKQGSTGLRYIQEEVLTLEMCLVAVRKSPTVFKYVHEKYREDVKNILAEEGIEVKALKQRKKDIQG